jgi:hypothetical protein
VLSAERGWAEVGVCLSLVSRKATAWNRGVEGPDVKVLDARSVQGCADEAVNIVNGGPLRAYPNGLSARESR